MPPHAHAWIAVFAVVRLIVACRIINTLVALIKLYLLDFPELTRQIHPLNHEPALIVECARVMDKVCVPSCESW